MRLAIFARPDWPEADTTPVPADPSWVEQAWVQINAEVST
jgi:hypothetical protein